MSLDKDNALSLDANCLEFFHCIFNTVWKRKKKKKTFARISFGAGLLDLKKKYEWI